MTMQGNELVLLAIVILVIGIFLMLNEGGEQQASEPPAPPEPQEPQSDVDPFQSASAQEAPQQASAEAPSDSGAASGDEQSAFQAP